MIDPHLVNVLGQIAGMLILIASVFLWYRRQTPWLLLAMIAQFVAMLCRAVLTLSPSLYTQVTVLQLVWPLSSCAFGIGLLCHALLETPAAPQTTTRPDVSP